MSCDVDEENFITEIPRFDALRSILNSVKKPNREAYCEEI